MGSETVKASEIDAYEFGDPSAPEGFDNEAAGYEDPPVGNHQFEIADFEIAENHTFKGKDYGEWIGNQIRPRLVIPKDQPHGGASILDFLPLPTPGRSMPRALANRWANFIRAFGFQPPPNKVVPAGFTLHSLLGTRGGADIIDDEYDGKVTRKVKFFGYKPLDGKANGTAKRNGSGATSGVKRSPASKPAAAATPPAAPDDLDLDDL